MNRSGSQRRLIVVAPLALAAFAITGWSWWLSEDQPPSTTVTGVSDAGDPTCGPVLSEPAGGSGAHVDDKPIRYESAPPSFGDHSSRWEVGARTFYGVEDRPDVSVLVHNLEHGYNVLWYDETVIDDSGALEGVREIASEYASLGIVRKAATAFIAVPWTDADGAAFPEGMNYALTHWYADPTDRSSSRADELGLTQYCADISAASVRQWMDDYPLREAPEGYPDLM